MIRDLPSTSTSTVVKELLRLRNDVGAMAMGRVLTLIVSVDEDDADAALQAANDATRLHPARIVVVVSANSRGKGRLDAQIRVGGDAGASEIVVLRLYGDLTRQQAAVVTPLLLPDSPIVAWWPGEAPKDVADSPVGQMAHRRITDAAAEGRDGTTELRRRARTYRPGDTDLAWTRITRWRALLAASLEGAPYEPVDSATVVAEAGDPSAELLAGWLAHALRTPVSLARSGSGTGLVSVRLDRASGPVDLVRSDDGTDTATLSRVDSLPRLVALHTPSLAESLAEELRRLDADEVYASALCEGIPLVRRSGSRQEAVGAGRAPDGPASIDTSGRRQVASSRLTGPPPSDDTTRDGVRDRVVEGLESARRSDVRVHPDKVSLADAVVSELVRRVEAAVADRGEAHVVLTGGSMGSAVVESLARRGRAGDLDRAVWREVHLWWGDERFVPSGSPDRNDAQADEAGLGEVPVLRRNVHRAPSGRSPQRLAEAAARYATALAEHAAPVEPAAEAGRVAVPELDVVLLGVGPDAHVASLFPGSPQLRLTSVTTAAVPDSPKDPPMRVTLTLPALSSGRAVWLVVAGEDKAEAVDRALAARDDPELPASCVRGRDETVWWVDEACAPSTVLEGSRTG
ncbi:6-phosphogluconolactonase [Ornithinimicrobium cerasi]|uniref:6-phosphogluconolactonase n=1 Tax=Ornithinimicrobium cerasi TaxID=2248773 RepID=UPI001379690E|nr:6-phosphogluconolactonase [Ornithinimicrobium cerasi]